MIDAGLIVSGLRLLLDGYKLAAEKLGGQRKDDPDPVKLEEVIADVQASAPNGPPDPARVEQQIDRTFSLEQANKIKGDLASFALLADPPKLEEFNYWIALVQIAKSLQSVAKKTEIFGLRGQFQSNTRYLPFEKTSLVFVPKAVIAHSLPFPKGAYRSEVTEVVVALLDSDSEIPLGLGVAGQLYMATSMGEQYQKSVGDRFTISSGTEKNQLRLTPDNRFGAFVAVEYRVTALEITKIVKAMQSDFADYAAEISKERIAARELAQNVTEIVQNLSDKRS